MKSSHFWFCLAAVEGGLHLGLCGFCLGADQGKSASMATDVRFDKRVSDMEQYLKALSGLPSDAGKKWSYILENRPPWETANAPRDPYIVAEAIKAVIFNDDGRAMQIFLSCPEVLRKLNFTQDELDSLGNVLKPNVDGTGFAPSKNSLTSYTASQIMKELTGRDIKTYDQFLSYKNDRAERFRKFWSLLDKESDPEKKWGLFFFIISSV